MMLYMSLTYFKHMLHKLSLGVRLIGIDIWLLIEVKMAQLTKLRCGANICICPLNIYTYNEVVT